MCDQAPFYPGQKVVSLIDQREHNISKGDVNTVDTIKYCCDTAGFRLRLIGVVDYVPNGLRGCCACKKDLLDSVFLIAKNFAPLNPYSNSVSKELAEEAVKVRIEIDQPVKQLEQAN